MRIVLGKSYRYLILPYKIGEGDVFLRLGLIGDVSRSSIIVLIIRIIRSLVSIMGFMRLRFVRLGFSGVLFMMLVC